MSVISCHILVAFYVKRMSLLYCPKETGTQTRNAEVLFLPWERMWNSPYGLRKRTTSFSCYIDMIMFVSLGLTEWIPSTDIRRLTVTFRK